MSKFLFLADFYADQVNGGGELNNEVLIEYLSRNNEVLKKNTFNFSFEESYKNYKIIISNFIGLSEDQKNNLIKNKNYIIYEHDHKYLKSRNPAKYADYKAPQSEIINYEFYKNANFVLCQSEFHKEILLKNLNINNVISLSGNLWSDEAIQIIEEKSLKNKNKVCSIMLSDNWHKNTEGAIEFCKKNNLYYDLIPPMKNLDFLEKLSNNDTLVFLPKTPETLSRIAVEARMMNMSIKTNKNLGATSEEWFSLKGKDLIKYIKSTMRNNIISTVERCF